MQHTLTTREKQILHLASLGYSSKEIADTIGRQPTTIETHKVNIYRKLNARNITHAVRIAVKSRIIK